MATKDIGISSLHTGEAAPLYASLGWKATPLSAVVVSASSVVAACALQDTASISISQLTDRAQLEQHIDSLAPMHAKYIAQFSGCFVRSREYWQTWWIEETLLRNCLVAQVNGQVVAYLVAAFDNDGNKVLLQDTACIAGSESLQQALLARAVEVLAPTQPPTTDVQLPLSIARQVLGEQVLQAAEHIQPGCCMYRAVADGVEQRIGRASDDTQHTLPLSDTHVFLKVDAF
jgi:hypothetical protein